VRTALRAKLVTVSLHLDVNLVPMQLIKALFMSSSLFILIGMANSSIIFVLSSKALKYALTIFVG